MDVFGLLNTVVRVVRVTIKIAVAIRDTQRFPTEIRETAGYILSDLTIVGSLLDYLQNFSHRVTVQDENFLLTNIISLQSIVNNTHTILQDIQRDRSFFQRLFLGRDDCRRQLREASRHLHNSCELIQRTLPTIGRVSILRRDFPDFRRTFRNVPEKTLTFYDFSIIRNTPNTILNITLEEFDTTQCLFYLKVGNEQFFLCYQLRTWSALNPKLIVLEQRKRYFWERLNNRNNASPSGSISSLDSISSSQSQPQSTASTVSTTVVSNIHHKLEFSEFFMSHDDICGMTFTQSLIYIATKCEITIASLTTQSIIAQYGTEGNEPNTFKNISYIYVPLNDKTNLYIVDRGQSAVHQYKIDDTGDVFKYIRRYVVIGDVPQQCNLVSCAIYKRNLYVSDDANDCLHIFSLNGERQSSYLCDNTMTPFTPGSICAHEDYLYVTNCSPESPGILVFNEECQPVDWFRNPMLKEILAIDIDLHINELYILTTEETGNDKKKKRPLIVSMDLLLRPQ